MSTTVDCSAPRMRVTGSQAPHLNCCNIQPACTLYAGVDQRSFTRDDHRGKPLKDDHSHEIGKVTHGHLGNSNIDQPPCEHSDAICCNARCLCQCMPRQHGTLEHGKRQGCSTTSNDLKDWLKTEHMAKHNYWRRSLHGRENLQNSTCSDNGHMRAQIIILYETWMACSAKVGLHPTRQQLLKSIGSA